MSLYSYNPGRSPQTPYPRVDSTIDLFAFTEPRADAKPEPAFDLFIKVEPPPLIGWRTGLFWHTTAEEASWAEQRT